MYNMKNNNDKLMWISSIIISGLMIMFCQNKSVSYILVFSEVIFLFYLFMRNKITEYVCFYLIFISTSLEFSESVGTTEFYSIKNIRIGGLNLGIWLLIPIWIKILYLGIDFWNVKKESPSFFKMGIGLIVINIIAAVNGIILIMINDNEIQLIDNLFGEYIECIYSYMILPVTFFLAFCIIINHYRNSFYKIENALYSALCGCVMELVISKIMNIEGHYGSETTLLGSIIFVFLPFMILLSFENINYNKVLNVVISFAGTLLLIKNNGGGKILISIFIVGLLLVYYGFQKKSYLFKVAWLLCIIMSLFLIPMIVKTLINISNNYVLEKINVVKNFLMFWQKNWIDLLDYSPKSRIGELVNIFTEYSKKPWLFLGGKGYLGSVIDYCGLFNTAPNDYVRLAAFTSEQWEHGIFFKMHEITSIILNFGFLGIIYILSLLRIFMKNLKNNVWLVFAVYWFIVFYGYSFTIATFGVIVFFYSLIRIDNKKNPYFLIDSIRDIFSAVVIQKRSNESER